MVFSLAQKKQQIGGENGKSGKKKARQKEVSDEIVTIKYTE